MKNQIELWKKYLVFTEKKNKEIRKINTKTMLEVMEQNSKNLADFSDGKHYILPRITINIPELQPSMEEFMTLIAQGKLK